MPLGLFVIGAIVAAAGCASNKSAVGNTVATTSSAVPASKVRIGTTVVVSTPPEAREFCAQVAAFKEKFYDTSNDDYGSDQYVKDLGEGWADLVGAAPDATSHDMTIVYDYLYGEKHGGVSDADFSVADKATSAYMARNCGFTL